MANEKVPGVAASTVPPTWHLCHCPATAIPFVSPVPPKGAIHLLSCYFEQLWSLPPALARKIAAILIGSVQRPDVSTYRNGALSELAPGKEHRSKAEHNMPVLFGRLGGTPTRYPKLVTRHSTLLHRPVPIHLVMTGGVVCTLRGCIHCQRHVNGIQELKAAIQHLLHCVSVQLNMFVLQLVAGELAGAM